jgi:phosphohistidine phosphatase
MKTIYIVRHAKSSWKESDLSDELRPLLEKGKKRTKKVIDYLHKKDVRVDYIISSHAVRAYETAKILAHALKYPADNIKVDKAVYTGDADELVNQFYDIPERYNSVMIVGHNPTLTNFVNLFVEPKIEWLPTSGVVCIEFLTDKWEEINLAETRTAFMVFPKDLS